MDGGHPRVVPVLGSAADEAVTERAADGAEEAGSLTGWVTDAAVFRDAGLAEAPAAEVLELVVLNLAPADVGCATAVRRFLAAGTGGAIVDVSSTRRSGRCAAPCRTPPRRRPSRG